MATGVSRPHSKSRTIAVLTDAYVDYQRSIIDIATGFFAEAGYLTLCFAGGSLEEPKRGQHNPAAGNEIYRLVEKCEAAGILIFTGGVGRHVDEQTLARFMQRFDVPIVCLGKASEGIPSIVTDDDKSMREMMEHVLIHEDRQRIAFLRGLPTDEFSRCREEIFRDCLSEAGRTIDEDLFPVGNYNTCDAYNATCALFKKHPDVDTIVAANDLMALSAAHAVSSLGLCIPDDVAITGFDDTREATEHTPALTTVRQSMAETAESGARQLLQLIDSGFSTAKPMSPAKVTRLAGKLIIRRSTPTSTAPKSGATIAQLKHSIIQSMSGLDTPAAVELEQLTNAMIEWIYNGSTSQLTECVDAIRATCIDRSYTHWVRDLCNQIESLTFDVLCNLDRADDIVILRGVLSTLRESVWTELLAQEFDGHRVSQARASLQVQLGSCTRLEDMLSVLNEWLANVRPHHFYLVQYSQPATSIPSQARLVHAAIDGEVIRHTAAEFKTTNLLPQETFNDSEFSQLIFYPVYAGDLHYGYILIEALGLEQQYIDDIALSLGNAMRGQYFIKSLQSQTSILKRSNDDLDRLVNYDALTALPNRRYFEQQVNKACERGSSDSLAFAVVFIDLDGFKMVNDTLGHESGDQLLIQVASRLNDSLGRLTDKRGLAARIAGDEFTLLVMDAGSREMDILCKTLLETLSRTYKLGDQHVTISASMGYAFYPEDAMTTSMLLKCADTAMYDAKARGKNRFVRTCEKLIRASASTLSLAQDLRLALDNDELTLEFQPRIDLKTQTMKGVEALTRWYENTPDGPQLKAHPDEFIGVAEKSGLISRLDTQALQQACRQARLWVEAGTPLKVSINVSVIQLKQTGFVKTVLETLQRNRLEPGLLELEITESVMMADIEDSIRKLEQLRRHGLQISIDDFGTGYSSLAYLKRLPVTCLKVDRSFIKDIARDSGSIDAALVHSIVAVAKSMQCSVVAEGIETEAQRRFAIAAGCDQGQGYFFAEPLSVEAIAALMQNKTQKAA